jgi:hypothetical protein
MILRTPKEGRKVPVRVPLTGTPPKTAVASGTDAATRAEKRVTSANAARHEVGQAKATAGGQSVPTQLNSSSQKT